MNIYSLAGNTHLPDRDLALIQIALLLSNNNYPKEVVKGLFKRWREGGFFSVKIADYKVFGKWVAHDEHPTLFNYLHMIVRYNQAFHGWKLDYGVWVQVNTRAYGMSRKRGVKWTMNILSNIWDHIAEQRDYDREDDLVYIFGAEFPKIPTDHAEPFCYDRYEEGSYEKAVHRDHLDKHMVSAKKEALANIEDLL